jgi:hypothetical protein
MIDFSQWAAARRAEAARDDFANGVSFVVLA